MSEISPLERDPTLRELRCPFERKNTKTNQVSKCNKLIIFVHNGSSGVGYCSVCKKDFDFNMVDQKTNTSIRVQSVK